MSLELQYQASGASGGSADSTGAGRKAHTVKLDGTLMIGSLTSNQVALPEPGIEPIHCMIERGADGAWRVTDLGTLAGVRLNGKRIEVEAAIAEGDVIEIGSARMVVRGGVPQRTVTSEKAKSATQRSRLFYHPRHEASKGRYLEVVAYWGDTVLNIDHFHPSLKGFDSVTIGDPTKAHFITGGREFFKTAVLAEVEDGSCVLRLDDGMKASVRQSGKIQKVRGHKRLTLGPRDYAHVEFGPVRYFLHYANQPNVELPRNTSRDVLMMALSWVAAAAYVVLVALALTITPKVVEVEAKDPEIYETKYKYVEDKPKPRKV